MNIRFINILHKCDHPMLLMAYRSEKMYFEYHQIVLQSINLLFYVNELAGVLLSVNDISGLYALLSGWSTGMVGQRPWVWVRVEPCLYINCDTYNQLTLARLVKQSIRINMHVYFEIIFCLINHNITDDSTLK